MGTWWQGLLGDLMVVALSLQCQPRGGWDRAWPGVVIFGGCCHPSHPTQGCAGLLMARPPRPGCHSISVPSGSQPGRGGAWASRWSGTTGHGGGPLPPWVPQPALLSPRPGKRCPQAVPTQGAGCLWRRRVPTPWRTTLSPTRGHDVPTPGTSQALASNVHEERGGRQGRPVLGEQMDVAIP